MKNKKDMKEFSTDRNDTIKIFLGYLFCLLLLLIPLTIIISWSKYENIKVDYDIILLITIIILITTIFIFFYYISQWHKFNNSISQLHKVNNLIVNKAFIWTNIKCQFTHLKINNCYNENFNKERNQQFKFNKLKNWWLVVGLFFLLINFYIFSFIFFLI